MLELSHLLLSLLTLIFLEIVLGIDNLVFITLASNSLPEEQRPKARVFGLCLALFLRLLLLAFVNYLSSLTDPLLTINHFKISFRDILLTVGGLFLIYKSTAEIHSEFYPSPLMLSNKHTAMLFVIAQIAVLDLIFSLDSIMTAIGMVQEFYLMAIAIIISIIVMIFANVPLSKFIEKNPSIKMLAISFILMVGMVLVADGAHFHVPRPYIYFSIAFSLFVETLNIKLQKRKIREE